MKIRQGFVSNSSSTSFCIVGSVYTEDEIDKIIPEGTAKLNSHQEYQESNTTVWGLSLHRIARTTMTYQEFEQYVKELLKEAGFPEKEVSIYEGGWYEG